MKHTHKTQAIKYTYGGKPYITKYGKRYYLEDVIRCAPFEYEGLMIHGTTTIVNTIALGAHICAGGETAIAVYLPIDC